MLLQGDTIEGVVLADHIISFVAKCSLFGNDTLRTAARLITRAMDGAEDEERAIMRSAIDLLTSHMELNRARS